MAALLQVVGQLQLGEERHGLLLGITAGDHVAARCVEHRVWQC